MKLEIRPSQYNHYPIQGILIKDSNVLNWMTEIERMNLSLNDILVYPLPDITPNSIWGCLIMMHSEIKMSTLIDKNRYCQLKNQLLFIPEYTDIYPRINDAEFIKILSDNKHIFHPEFGLYKLEKELDWNEILRCDNHLEIESKKPIETVHLPNRILKVEVISLSPEDELANLENKIVSKKEKIENQPLNFFEKLKLAAYRGLFISEKDVNGNWSFEKKEVLNLFEKFIGLFSSNTAKNIANDVEKDLEELEKRNSTEMEKLLEYLRKNPEEALKYAIPLDDSGLNRGDNYGSFNMNLIWSNLNLFNNSTNTGSGNAFVGNDAYYKLQTQYNQTAQDFISKKEYEKAAFVYLKLLKNYYSAAKTLEDGKLYSSAASVYLKYMNNKLKAAECYENGMMYSDAISLYKEMNSKEKVGDLYIKINNQEEAHKYYQFVVDEYIEKKKYVLGSLLLRNKMNDKLSAQNLLLDGWRNNFDSFNCLNNYFNNLEDKKMLLNEIENIYQNELNGKNEEDFINVIKIEHKRNQTEKRIIDIAYDVISKNANRKPNIINSLSDFNPDIAVSKDIWRFKSNNKK